MKGDGTSVPSLVDIDQRMSFLDLYRIVRDGRGRMPALGGMLKWYELAAISGFVYTADPEDAPANWKQKPGPKDVRQRRLPEARRRTGPARLEARPGARSRQSTSPPARSAGRFRSGDYPQVLAAGRSGLGAESYGGPILTASGLLFIAATPDARLRAFEAKSGELLWQSELPAAGFATPATYRAEGRQFVVVAAGGGKLGQPSGSRYVAFALPALP
jgi:quinoprotein glucose dehydrogenase